MSTSSIREYHLGHPGAVSVPSITQSRGLAAVLRRMDLKRLRRLRRRERIGRALRRLHSLFRKTFHRTSNS